MKLCVQLHAPTICLQNLQNTLILNTKTVVTTKSRDCIIVLFVGRKGIVALNLFFNIPSNDEQLEFRNFGRS